MSANLMTAQEMIKQLSAYPPHTPIVMRNDTDPEDMMIEGCYDGPVLGETQMLEVRTGFNPANFHPGNDDMYQRVIVLEMPE